MTRIDYDTDVFKHYVRKQGWLEECIFRQKQVLRDLRAGRRTQPFTYFTFCASNAIDVFMLEQAGLLRRDAKTRRLENVYFCEYEQSEFERIVTRIGSSEGGFLGDFKEFVLFADSKDTKGKDRISDGEEVPDVKVREKFRNKELYNRFRSLFPLDVINLDPYGVFFPPATGIYSPMLRVIENLFAWQNVESAVDSHTCSAFTLMLTAHVALKDFKPESVEDMHKIAAENIEDHEPFREAFLEKFGSDDPKVVAKTNFAPYFSTVFPKIVAPVARKHGWFGEHRYIFIYTSEDREVRDKGYHMMSSVIRYNKLPEPPGFPRSKAWPQGFEDRYVTELCNILRHKPVDVNALFAREANVIGEVRNHLFGVVTFREDFLRSLQ